MIFSGANFDRTMSGEKTQTRRRQNGRPPRVKVGGTYAIQRGRYKPGEGRLLVLRVWGERAGAISDADARAEGFADRRAFLEEVAHLWKCPLREARRELVWAIEYRRIS